TPALIHGGPFANIAPGTNSILATKTALQLSDYVVTEAGFSTDLGGEKFFDFMAPLLGNVPDTIVIVATVRALKMYGGEDNQNLKTPNLSALKLGLVNLGQHIKSMKRYGVPVVVAINQFTHDTKEELALVNDYAKSLGVEAYVADVWGQGGLGAQDLATGVVQATEQAESQNFQPLYQPEDEAIVKINHIVQEIYGGDKAVLSGKAEKQLATFKKYGWDKLPIIMAKTQNSLTDDSKRIGAPKNFDIHIREFIPKLGA